MKTTTSKPTEYFDSLEIQINHDIAEIKEILSELRSVTAELVQNPATTQARLDDMSNKLDKAKEMCHHLLEIPIVDFSRKYNYFRPEPSSLTGICWINRN